MALRTFKCVPELAGQVFSSRTGLIRPRRAGPDPYYSVAALLNSQFAPNEGVQT